MMIAPSHPPTKKTLREFKQSIESSVPKSVRKTIVPKSQAVSPIRKSIKILSRGKNSPRLINLSSTPENESFQHKKKTTPKLLPSKNSGKRSMKV